MRGGAHDDRSNQAEAAQLWRLVDIPFDQLDKLPFGAIVVDRAGGIIAYNQYEASLARQDRDAIIGRNFFRDVAPCTAVARFEGRMQAFVHAKDRVSERFDFFFAFGHGPVEVSITLLKLRRRGQVLIAVERRGPAAPRNPVDPRTDED